MTEAVTKTIVGPCEEISEKNGFTTFHINVGTQYPERLSTKLAPLITEARAVGQQTATWTFKQSDGKENPNRPGTFYQNKYLEKVQLGEHAAEPDTASVSPAPQRAQSGTHEPLPVGDRERSIVRQACIKAASVLYQGKGNPKSVPGDDEAPLGGDAAVLDVIAAAARFETWVMRDLEETPF